MKLLLQIIKNNLLKKIQFALYDNSYSLKIIIFFKRNSNLYVSYPILLVQKIIFSQSQNWLFNFFGFYGFFE